MKLPVTYIARCGQHLGALASMVSIVARDGEVDLDAALEQLPIHDETPETWADLRRIMADELRRHLKTLEEVGT